MIEIHPEIDFEDVEDRRYQLFGFIQDLYRVYRECENPWVNPEIFDDLNRFADEVTSIKGTEAVLRQIQETHEFITDNDH